LIAADAITVFTVLSCERATRRARPPPDVAGVAGYRTGECVQQQIFAILPDALRKVS
jgi:hypothetical protein